MIYHYQRLSAKQWALYEEGFGFTGPLTPEGLAAMIDEMGPYMGGAGTKWQLSGGLADPEREFGSLEAAKSALETIVRANGDEIKVR